MTSTLCFIIVFCPFFDISYARFRQACDDTVCAIFCLSIGETTENATDICQNPVFHINFGKLAVHLNGFSTHGLRDRCRHCRRRYVRNIYFAFYLGLLLFTIASSFSCSHPGPRWGGGCGGVRETALSFPSLTFRHERSRRPHQVQCFPRLRLLMRS